MARNLKVWILRRDCVCSRNKDADQLCSYCTADLRLGFCLCMLLVFHMQRLKCHSRLKGKLDDLRAPPTKHANYSHLSSLQVCTEYWFIPPAKRSFRGVYCFQPVRHSVIPSFRHSVNIWTSLLNNLSSFCLICFKFSPHLRHQTIHVWYEFRGQRVSIARVMGLFKSSYNMFAIVLKVHTL